MGNFYDQGIRRTYEVAAADLSSAGTLLTFRGPAGLTGRIEDVTSVITTAVTVADSSLLIGSTGENLITSVPFTGSAIGDAVAPTKAELVAGVDIPADVDIDVDTDGGATAGAADIAVTVIWY